MQQMGKKLGIHQTIISAFTSSASLSSLPGFDKEERNQVEEKRMVS